ncbi:hypothetical protein DFH08DRAFT_799436 [Mycena albidolilacea]|uniref:Uncharacterized protein n=1 Tax=Mycena albidolilacea TaxID=1033008 RepID=A0AAD7F2F2_9AGAR|nr:hypothetical protein DFH08DRAFT_799436 [Mycena albidolilacea]
MGSLLGIWALVWADDEEEGDYTVNHAEGGAAHGGLWHIVQPIFAPPHGIRAKVCKVAGTVKERESARMNIVLNTISEIHGTTYRDSLVLNMLHSFHTRYALLPEEWAVVVLNTYSIECLNLTPVLTATDCFPKTLVDLILFAPASIPVARTAEFMVLLHLLGNTTWVKAPGVCLRIPGAWITLTPPPPVGLEIQCVTSLVVVRDFAVDVGALAEFLSPFEPGLRWVKFQPITRCVLEHMHIVDELRQKLLWVKGVLCVRSMREETQMGSHQKEEGKEGV